jgi:hypothetical protein
MQRYRQREHTFAMEADDQLVVVDRQGAAMLTLNAVGAMLWNSVAEPRSVDELVDVCQARWPEVAPTMLRGDIEQFVAQAVEAGIVVGVDG